MDITDVSLKVMTTGNTPGPGAAASPKHDRITPSGAADPYAVDRILHAQQARVTSGLSLSSLWLACADWAIHMGNAPARRAALGMKALEQWTRYFEAASGAHVIDAAPQDHRFRSPLWQK